MAKLNQCDSCGAQAPDVMNLNRMGTPLATESEGADGWALVHIRITRKLPSADPRAARQPMFGATGHSELASSIDLCPDCAKRMIAASGCEERIATELPPPIEGGLATGIMPGGPRVF